MLAEAGRYSIRAQRHRSLARQVSRARRLRSKSGRSYEEFAYRIEFWGDEVEQLSIINPTIGEVVDNLEQIYIYPAKHFVLPEERIHSAVDEIRKELRERLELFKSQGKLLEAQRLSARTRYDIEMMMEMGYCPGIENYSRPLSGRNPGEPPYTLFDFFPKDYLLIVDESHATVPQIGAMYNGDRSRKVDARRARLPLAERAGQSAAEVRRVARAGQAGRLRLGDAGPVRARTNRRRSRRAGRPADRPARSGDRSRLRPRPGAAFARADSRTRRPPASGRW